MNEDIRRGLGAMAIGVALLVVGLGAGFAADVTLLKALGVVGFWVAVIGLVAVGKTLLSERRHA